MQMKERILVKIFLLAHLFVCTQSVLAGNGLKDVRECLKWINPKGLRLAIEDLRGQSGFDYKQALKEWEYITLNLKKVSDQLNSADSLTALPQAEVLVEKQRAILLANPLLDMDRIVVTRFTLGDGARREMADALCMPPSNYMGLMDTRHTGYDAEICELSDLRGKQIRKRTVFKPTTDVGIADVQLHWDADRLLFASAVPVRLPSADTIYSWQIHEVGMDGNGFKLISKVTEPDLEFADPCYLPDGRILFTTNIGYNGIPCENGLRTIHNLALYNPANGELRKISFDQDGNWSPSVLNNGRIMYTRWEYTDLTHYFSRIVMHSNPDGTETKALYGSGSFWPNSIYDMKQLPTAGSRFIGVVTGHHGVPRSGRLFIFDPVKGRKEEKGVVQEVPFKDRKTIPEIKDYLVDGIWPQFTRPYPLSDNYFLVAAKPYKQALWGIYLVDVFDNMVLLAENEGDGYVTPIPVVKRTIPAAIPDRIKADSKEATVFIQDLYEGEGLKGVPRGTVKHLRVFTYEYAYLNSPSDFDAQGIQSGWDIKRELGTVKVEEDGSVIFKVPANTPISIQPLDEKGRAVQWMRSWFTPMPGEVVSCIGCHENQNILPIPKRVMASQKQPSVLTPPEGGIRPFTFAYEIQPVLDRYCIGCHDGIKNKMTLKGEETELYKRGVVTKIERQYRKSYLNLHPYVYRQGPEADIHVLRPYEYHASNSELICMLEKGHQGVKMEEQDLATLYKWIDLNAPYFGSFEIRYPYKGFEQYKRRRELLKKYGGTTVDWQKEISEYASSLEKQGKEEPIQPVAQCTESPKTRTFPEKNITHKEQTIELIPGVSMHFVWIPVGKYIKGRDRGGKDPVDYRTMKIKEGFWMGSVEVTNAQYAGIFPEHDSRFIGQQWKDHTSPGYPANRPEQPVVRVSWEEAMKYCEKLSHITGLTITLPTEAQWEWACRAGTNTDMWYGDRNTDYSTYENMADQQIRDLAVMGVDPKPMPVNYPLRKFWDFVPRDTFANDGNLISIAGGRYTPNAWGLYDMHGNVAEWTCSDRLDGVGEVGDKVVCGGSWRDRAKTSTAFYRRYYKSWQAPFNVGFRVIIKP